MSPRGVFRVAAAGKMVRLLAHDAAGEPVAELLIVSGRYRPDMAELLLELLDGHGVPPTLPRGHAKALRRASRGFLQLG